MSASLRLLQSLIALAFLAGVLGCANKVTLTLETVPPDGGRLLSSAGPCSGTPCQVKVDQGSTVTVTADRLRTRQAPIFAGWGGMCRGPAAACTFIANTDATAIAYYRSTTKRVAAGAHHTCVLRPAGDVVCWGRNSSGQVGNDSTADNLNVSPVKVSGGTLQNIVQIATGGYHSCALDSVGGVWCWGSNREGALGFGTDAESRRAVRVPSVSSAVSITAGGHHSCAVLSNGTAICWGSNGYGQLGDLTTNHSNTPVAVSGVTEIVALAAGAYHTCALRTDSRVVCWGAGNDGQIGIGVRGPATNFPPGSPVLTELAGGGTGPTLTAVSIAASIGLGWEGTSVMGGYHSCAIGTDRKTYCWGNDNYGQVRGIGRPSILTSSVITLASHRLIFQDEPQPFPASSMIAAGAYHTCTVKANGIDCWGDNASGQIAGQQLGSSTRITAVFDLAAGGYHTCAVVGPSAPGTVLCWGWNADGQVNGIPGPTNFMTPTMLTLP